MRKLNFFILLLLLFILTPIKSEAKTFSDTENANKGIYVSNIIESNEKPAVGDILELGSCRYKITGKIRIKQKEGSFISYSGTCKLLGRIPKYKKSGYGNDLVYNGIGLAYVEVPERIVIEGTAHKPNPDTSTDRYYSFEVASAADNAFKNDPYLTELSISTKIIPKGLCRNCKKLSTVILNGADTKEIKPEAFYNCPLLYQVLIKSAKLSKVGKNAFKTKSSWFLTIGCLDKKASNYKKLVSKAGGKRLMTNTIDKSTWDKWVKNNHMPFRW